MDVQTVLEQLFFTTVKIDTTYADGRKGTATGCFVGYERSEGRLDVLVTNKHVVAGAIKCEFLVHLGAASTPDLGRHHRFVFQNLPDHWHGHPNPAVDVAVLPFGGLPEKALADGHSIFIRAVQSTLFPTADDLLKLDGVEDLVFFGYPRGVYDRVNLLPVARRAITATPISVDYEGRPAFLIDASVFPGSSGSPVFVVKPNLIRPVVHFLGILTESMYWSEENEVRFRPIPTVGGPFVTSLEWLNIGVVTKSKVIMEAIEDAYLKRVLPGLKQQS